MGFIDGLKRENIEGIRKFPKADLHNHFVLGGSRKYLRERMGENIQAIKKPLLSMNAMHAWNEQNIGQLFNSSEGRRVLSVTVLVQKNWTILMSLMNMSLRSMVQELLMSI